jgi:putative FmdB family regulatory protein
MNMPKYDAECEKCGHKFEYSVPILNAGDPPPPCEKCGDNKTKKVFVINSGGFILKGDGWFKKGGY